MDKDNAVQIANLTFALKLIAELYARGFINRATYNNILSTYTKNN